MAYTTQKDIDFVKSVARDFEIEITDEEAQKAHNTVSENYAEQDYYYGLKEYLVN